VPLYPEIEPYDHGLLDVGDGQRIYWETCGNPDGRPAVAFHGGPGSGCDATWARFFDPGAYRIVLFDQRGCGRSTPHASSPDVDLSVNTTWHLLGDIEKLREYLGVDRWLIFGGSWGATLAILYAEQHPDRVSALVMGGVTTSRRREIDWIARGGMAPLFPADWALFLRGLPESERDGDPIEAYHRLLHDPDPAVRAAAARSWCLWETAIMDFEDGRELSGRFADPDFAYMFARLVTHYFRHDAWLEDSQLLRDAGALADVPGVMVQGRLDLQAPLTTAWELKQVWPRAELIVVGDAGHATDTVDMARHLVRATDHFAAR
jgi:proline iminopeptidase